VEAPKVTTTLGMAALVALSEVTDIVVVPELSEGTDEGLAERLSVTAALEAPMAVGAPLAPQPTNRTVIAANDNALNKPRYLK
jgi:hypothetical protein